MRRNCGRLVSTYLDLIVIPSKDREGSIAIPSHLRCTTNEDRAHKGMLHLSREIRTKDNVQHNTPSLM